MSKLVTLNYYDEACRAVAKALSTELHPDDDIYRMLARAKDKAEERSIDRKVWLTAARLTFTPGEKEPCWVCGRFKSITHAHHLVPLTTQYDRGFKAPHHVYVWLCPNHHVMAHIFISSDERSMKHRAMSGRDKSVADLSVDLSEREFKKMLKLMHASSLNEVA